MSDELPRRILILKPSAIGDVVHALPVLAVLRRAWPSARIAWLINDRLVPLLAGHPLLDELIPFDRRCYGRFGRHVEASQRFVEFLAALRARRFDVVLDLQGLFRTGFLARAAGATRRLGLADATEGAWLFYTDRTAPAPGPAHVVERNLRIVELLRLEACCDAPSAELLPVNPMVRQDVSRLLRQRGLPDGARYAVLAPGTLWQTKRWPVERFARLGEMLHDRLGLSVVLTGGPKEAHRVAELASRCARPTVEMVAGVGVAELVALLDGAALTVAGDSGPIHIASTLGRPVVAIFGPSDPARNGPVGQPDHVVRAEVPCLGCRRRKLRHCPYAHRCMQALEPEAVFEVAQRAVAND